MSIEVHFDIFPNVTRKQTYGLLTYIQHILGQASFELICLFTYEHFKHTMSKKRIQTIDVIKNLTNSIPLSTISEVPMFVSFTEKLLQRMKIERKHLSFLVLAAEILSIISQFIVICNYQSMKGCQNPSQFHKSIKGQHLEIRFIFLKTSKQPKTEFNSPKISAITN